MTIMTCMLWDSVQFMQPVFCNSSEIVLPLTVTNFIRQSRKSWPVFSFNPLTCTPVLFLVLLNPALSNDE